MVTVFWVLIYTILGLVIALVLILSAYLAVLIAEKICDIKGLKLRVSRVKELEHKNRALYHETEIQNELIKRLERNINLFEETVNRYEYEARAAKKKQEETVMNILDLITQHGYSDQTSEKEKGYNEAILNVYESVKRAYGEEKKQ